MGRVAVQGGTYLFRREDLAGDRILLRKELAGGRRPSDLGVREGGAGGEGGFVREHGIVAAAARSRRGGEK